MPNNGGSAKAALLMARIRESKENAAALRELWGSIFGYPAPGDQQFFIWLDRHGFDIVADSIMALAAWVNRHGQELGKIAADRDPTAEETAAHTKGLVDLVQYASGIMKKKQAEQQ